MFFTRQLALNAQFYMPNSINYMFLRIFPKRNMFTTLHPL
jgi:hypothetical protein